MSGPHVAAFGTWRSPLSASDAASGATRFSGLAVEPVAASDEHGRDEQGGVGSGRDGEVTVWWAESRPAEGRVTIMGARGAEGGVAPGAADLALPAGFHGVWAG